MPIQTSYLQPCKAIAGLNPVLRSHKPSQDKTKFITILNKQNQVVSNSGGTKPAYTSNQLKQVKQREKMFKYSHDVYIADEENLYIPYWNASKDYPVKLIKV